MPGFSIKNIFRRIDTNNDKQLSDKEIYNMGKAAGLKKGFIVDERAEVKDAFLDKFDTNKDSKVSWDEFQKNSMKLIPADAYGADGKIDADKVTKGVNGAINDVDVNGDGKMSHKELYNSTKAKLAEAGESFTGTKAEIATKVAKHLLDANGDGAISRDEALKPAQDAVKLVNEANGHGATAAAEDTTPNS
tara:strand:+ start:474 stop:1046 length:573 start_codon:yes stop_codon:yes gene_type:complete